MHDDHQNPYEQMAYDHPYEQHIQQQAPLDPAVERVRKKLMRLMIISVGITMILIVAVLVGIIYKVMSTPTEKATVAVQNPPTVTDMSKAAIPSEPVKPEFINRTINLPVGTRILSQSLSGNLIALETLTPAGKTELVIYDYHNGYHLADVNVETDATPTENTANPE